MMQRILITVTGWPDNGNRELTRLIMLQECATAKAVTTAVVNRLAGVHTIAMRVMDEGEPIPFRYDAEIDRSLEILRYVTNRQL